MFYIFLVKEYIKKNVKCVGFLRLIVLTNTKKNNSENMIYTEKNTMFLLVTNF